MSKDMTPHRALCHNKPIINLVGDDHDWTSTAETTGSKQHVSARNGESVGYRRTDHAAICSRRLSGTESGRVRASVAVTGAVMRKWDIDNQSQPDAADRQMLTFECIGCGNIFERAPTIKGRKPKYCTSACVLEALRKVRQIKDVAKNCIQCGAEFFCTKSKRNRAKFCSRDCCWRHHGKNGSVKVPCDICGKIVSRNPSNVCKNNYCGYECMAKGKTLSAPRTNKWANVRKWFGRFGRMSECIRCGYNKHPGILVLHHKDRDRENNRLDNLEVLCPNCHALEHLEEHKNRWEGHQSTNPVKVARRKKTQEKQHAN